jgi:hypothetical protein
MFSIFDKVKVITEGFIPYYTPLNQKGSSIHGANDVEIFSKLRNQALVIIEHAETLISS